MAEKPLFNAKALAGSMLAGIIVIADPELYGSNGFAWWVTLLIFVAVMAVTYFVWYWAFPFEKEESESKNYRMLLAGAATIAIVLAAIFFMS